MSRSAKILAALAAELLVLPFAMSLSGGWPRIALNEIEMPGGVILPVERGGLYTQHSFGDSVHGWVFDAASMVQYDYDALMMAYHRLKFGHEYEEDLIVTRDTSQGGVPFEYAFSNDLWFRDGSGLVLVMHTTMTAEYGDYGVINFMIDLDESEEVQDVIPFFKRATWLLD